MPTRLIWIIGYYLSTCGIVLADLGDTMRTTKIAEPIFHGEAFVYEAGREHADTIVLVHGIGNDGAEIFADIVPWLARDYHVVAFDLPGFGRSSKANVLYSPANYTHFIKFVVDKFVQRPFVLLGHSLGGAIAVRYAAQFPNDVQRLIAVDAAGILHRVSYSEYLSRLGIGALPNVYPQQKRHLGNFAGAVLRTLERINIEPETLIASATMRQSLLDASPAKIAGLALVLEDFSAFIPKVQAPTVMIWGRNDDIAPLRTGQLLTAMIPNAQLAVVDGAGHAPMLDAPAAFRTTLAQALRGEVASTPAPASVAARAAQCMNRRDATYTGNFTRLTVTNCTNVKIRAAYIDALEVRNSEVTIEDSYIGGGEVGLLADNATIRMTGGTIDSATAVRALDSNLDFAGVRLIGAEAAVRAPIASNVVFSVSEIRSPFKRGFVHGYYEATAKKPL